MFEKLFENDQCLIINKPHGVSVHNAEDKNVIEIFKEKGLDYTPVHRIDKETSGILILAKDTKYIDQLSITLKSSKKTYLTICRAQLKEESGIWNFPITNKAEGSKKVDGIKKDRVNAISSWVLLAKNPYFSLLEVTIETGRTHQIRKHCALARHAIIGDNRYGDKAFNKKISKLYAVSRMALHAHKLSIIIDGNPLNILCEAPTEFNKLVEYNYGH